MHAETLQDAIQSGLVNDDIRLEESGFGARAYADSVAAVLGLCVGKMAQSNNILVRWLIDPRNGSGKATPAFDRHAMPMVWDFSRPIHSVGRLVTGQVQFLRQH